MNTLKTFFVLESLTLETLTLNLSFDKKGPVNLRKQVPCLLIRSEIYNLFSFQTNS